MSKPYTAKEKILAERGLTITRPHKSRARKLTPAINPKVKGIAKTPLMRYLETKYGVAMEDILSSGSLSVVSARLGNEVDVTTISRWIKRFKLRYSKDNLPSCTNCNKEQPSCEVGICPILVSSELWDLVQLKKEEIINERNKTTNAGTTQLPQ